MWTRGSEKFENAKKCHICEGELPKNSTKIDHLAKIKDWLKIMGLPGRVQTYKKFENAKKCYICEEELPNCFTRMVHLANIKDWFKIMGLPGRVPTYKEVENKMNL